MRISEIDDDDKEKYSLSLSILNFLKASSKAQYMKKYLKNKHNIFKQILMNEDLKSSARINSIAIDIENTLIGNDMSCLINTIKGVQSIHPYSDVSVRVLMKMADVL